MLLSITSPVLAAKPEEPKENKPVAWVNFTGAGAGGQYNNPGHFEPIQPIPGGPVIEEFSLPLGQILAKRLADGSTVGHARLRFLKLDEPIPEYGLYPDIVFDIVDSSFYINGDAKVADILVTVPTPNPGIIFYAWWHIVDNGEPGGWVDEIWMMHTIVPASSPYPFGEPFNPYVYPAWIPWIMPQTIAPDNIQVHITDAYWD